MSDSNFGHINPAHSDYGQWESEVLAWNNRNAENDPYEPYQGIPTIWNADLHARGLRDREAWLVDSAHKLSRPSEEILIELGLD